MDIEINIREVVKTPFRKTCRRRPAEVTHVCTTAQCRPPQLTRLVRFQGTKLSR